MYLAEAVHHAYKYNINSPNHLPYNSVRTAFCMPPQHRHKWYTNIK